MLVLNLDEIHPAYSIASSSWAKVPGAIPPLVILITSSPKAESCLSSSISSWACFVVSQALGRFASRPPLALCNAFRLKRPAVAFSPNEGKASLLTSPVKHDRRDKELVLNSKWIISGRLNIHRHITRSNPLHF